mmetsp:Transcript_28256/g.68043  ORF Transcript_28256/g.68043 Transcript_28256/m.68043 type:complete len:213 (+) Transcript_28256:599-1237(+)
MPSSSLSVSPSIMASSSSARGAPRRSTGARVLVSSSSSSVTLCVVLPTDDPSGPRRPPRFPPFVDPRQSSTGASSSYEGRRAPCVEELGARGSRQHRFQYSALAINVAHDARKALPTLCPGPDSDVTNTRTTPFAIRSAVASSKYSGYRDIVAGRASRTAVVVDRGAVVVDRDAVVVAVAASIWLGWRYATMLSPAAIIVLSPRRWRYVATA